MTERDYGKSAVGLTEKMGYLLKDTTKEERLALFKYIADEDKLEKLLENQQLIKTPVVRSGKFATVGFRPDVWKNWK